MKKIILFALVAITLASCSTPKTMGEQYPAMYEEKPMSIAIMPPINQTTHAEAKDFFYTTLYLPLCEKGYYVYSPYLTMEMYQQESAYDAEMFLDKDISMFQKVLGADAVMFTIIRWCLLVLCALIDEGVIDIEARVRNLDRGYYQGLDWCCKFS